MTAEPEKKAHRGFAAMDKQRQKEIAAEGGRIAHARGNAHEYTTETARAAGRLGGQAVSKDRAHMAKIGRWGGLSLARSHVNFSRAVAYIVVSAKGRWPAATQRQAIERWAVDNKVSVVAWFTETVVGKARPELDRAIAAVREHDAGWMALSGPDVLVDPVSTEERVRECGSRIHAAAAPA